MNYDSANRHITTALLWIALLLMLYTGWLNNIRAWVTKSVGG